MNLKALGWNTFFEKSLQNYQNEHLTAGRVSAEHKERYEIYTESGPCWAEVTGRFRYLADSRADFPAVGDWVAVQYFPDNDAAMIHHVLPRKSRFSRNTAGVRTEEQILAANIDKVFIVAGLDHDFNVRRIERYLILTRESGAEPVILLNKSDLCSDLDDKLFELKSISEHTPVHVLSAKLQTGVEMLKDLFRDNETAVLIGSSGVGKSTIINRLIGEDVQLTQTVSGFMDKGRHTTVRRELFILPGGGLLIDTPGLREIQLWSGEESLSDVFEDIAQIAAQCRFRDCTHGEEPGCAVQAALSDGSLDERRFMNYIKMQREIRFLRIRQDEGAARAERARWKKIHADIKRYYKKK